jgi:serine/threonine protein phosphatase PrpC
MNYTGSAVTDVGIVKKTNQDSLTLKIAHTNFGILSMAVVCDGLGGLSMGEVASGNLVMAFDKWFKANYYRDDINWNEDFIRKEWETLVFDMNKKIIEYGNNNGCKLGTTVTAAMFVNDRFYCIHVGDSRLYEIDKAVAQLTKDQTVVAREVEQGILTPEQALTDSRRNVLLQCVGVTQTLMPQFISGNVKQCATYLLCSDGFRHEINDREIYDMCRYIKGRTPEEIQGNLSRLIELDKSRGERDNISAILIQAGNE